ncbi:MULTISPECIES: flavin reductase [Roseovarius]|uniref:flavin reductase n=1 Tax=Roseovarius TaxID=74030 RepID=UPI00273FDB56|nr:MULTISPECIES: flavin reductase [unclassified Roseovarius]
MASQRLSNEDCDALRRAFGAFATGVTIVTCQDTEGKPLGFTANSFTSVSLEPALLLICIAKTSTSLEHFRRCKSFAVNILSASQVDLSNKFASRQPDRFADVMWKSGENGAPLIDKSAAWFDCLVHQFVDAGDHIVLIGRVRDFDQSDLAPLIYLKGQYLEAPKPVEALMETANGGVQVGGLLAGSEGVLLQKVNGAWTVPMGRPQPGFRAARTSLDNCLSEAGVDVNWNVLYSVFDEPKGDGTWMFFHGSLDGTPDLKDGYRIFALDELPVDEMPVRGMRSMVRRYLSENRDGAFSLYADAPRRSGHIARFAGQATPWSDVFNLEEKRT